MPWEVEQKFAISNVQAVRVKLAELGVRFGAPVRQADHYFNHPARDFGQTDEALRLRQAGNDYFITYKGPKIDPTTKTRHELELPLPAGSKTIEQFTALLEALGFRPVATVEKTRHPGKLAWEGHQVEVAMDDVAGLGSFLELEIAADDRGLEAAKTAVNSLAPRLNLGPSERRSYLELLLLEKMP